MNPALSSLLAQLAVVAFAASRNEKSGRTGPRPIQRGACWVEERV